MPRVRSRDERGAVAILSALLAVVLFGFSAFAIDLGQAYAKKSLLQTNVDIAVMAAVAELETAGACNQEVIDKAVEFLQKSENEVPGQFAAIDLGGSEADIDGFIRCQNWRVDLWAPQAHVDFGPARVLNADNSGLDVSAHAAAQIKSPSQSSSLPMYAVAGCDSGYQQLTDPPPGPPPAAVVPDLSPDGPPYNTVVDLTISSPNPAEVPANSVAPIPIQLKGKDLGSTTPEVWFTTAEGAHVQADSAVTVSTSGPNFTLNVTTVPQAVLDQVGIWYVRVKTSAGWSAEADAEPFVVGDLLFCDGMVSGNFGTLKVARSTGTPATWLEMNIIKGFEPRMLVNSSSDVPCSPVDAELTYSSPVDCVSTDPGFPNEPATDGFIDGSGATAGRLDVDTTPGCDRAKGSNRTFDSPAINDDMLSCFITGGHSVAEVVTGVPEILSSDIFRSPRFFQIPILPVQASNGASGAYPIIGFRPGFITQEPLTSTADVRGSVTGHNGVTFHGGKVQQLNVVLFPEASLPTTAPPVGGEIDYTGSGTKVLVLVG